MFGAVVVEIGSGCHSGRRRHSGSGNAIESPVQPGGPRKYVIDAVRIAGPAARFHFGHRMQRRQRRAGRRHLQKIMQHRRQHVGLRGFAGILRVRRLALQVRARSRDW